MPLVTYFDESGGTSGGGNPPATLPSGTKLMNYRMRVPSGYRVNHPAFEFAVTLDPNGTGRTIFQWVAFRMTVENE